MIEIFMYIALGLIAAFLAGVALGWELAKRFAQSHSECRYVEVTPEEAHALINAYLQSKARHPSNRRFHHPEMEEEDDC